MIPIPKKLSLKVASLLLLLASSPIASAWYDPGLQRWINRDPIDELGFQSTRGHKSLQFMDLFPSIAELTEGLPNLYLFVHNSPAIGTDSFGLQRGGTGGGPGGYGRHTATCTAHCSNGSTATFRTTWFGYSVSRLGGQNCCQAATEVYCRLGCIRAVGQLTWSTCMAALGTPPILALP
jgi:hypothetical protein